MQEITKEKFIELYGEVEVKFVNYYKYTFTFEGQSLDDTLITIRVGGTTSDRIYKMRIDNRSVSVADLGLYADFGLSSSRSVEDVFFDDMF